MKFNEKLTKLRKSNGYTQEDLAEKLGVSRQAVARWEAGETTPEMAMLIGLCRVFKVSADYLILDDVETVDDIPIVKEKSGELEAVKAKNRTAHLVSGILFAFATVCFVIAIGTTTSRIALPFLIMANTASAFTSVYQFICYFRKK